MLRQFSIDVKILYFLLKKINHSTEIKHRKWVTTYKCHKIKFYMKNSEN